MDTLTKPELKEPKNPDSIAIDIAESSKIDIGINTFNEKLAVVIYIRPSYLETTRWLRTAGDLETRTFDAEALELKNRFLENIKDMGSYLFEFKTPTPSWGYIFELKYKARLYDIFRKFDL